jgi:hypothetical protein
VKWKLQKNNSTIQDWMVLFCAEGFQLFACIVSYRLAAGSFEK